MVSIEQFITVIHSAVLSANETLMKANEDLINAYFEPVTPGSSGESISIEGKTFENVIQDLKDALDEGQAKAEILKKVNLLANIKNAEAGQISSVIAGNLRPKTVTLQYPEMTGEGVSMRNVSVPLIALVPITMAQISEVKFKTNLEIIMEDETMRVSPAPSGFGDPEEGEARGLTTSKSNSVLEMTIVPSKGSEGLQLLIEGYEKVLRGQLPH